MGWAPGKMDFLSGPRQKEFKEFFDIQTGSMPGIYIDEFGHEWPDFLASGIMTLTEFFVSERVICGLTDEGIPFRRAIEMEVTLNECRALAHIPPPKYYVLEADIGIDTVEAMKIVEMQKLEPAQLRKHWNPRLSIASQLRPQLKYETWDRSPLFSARHLDQNLQEYTRLYCDHRVTFLALKQKWTNFKAPLLSVI